MATHKWRQRESRHFGTVWVPYAQIELQSVGGGFQPLALQIDSGAVVSILRRSVADLLGLRLEKGQKVELGSVGGGLTAAHVFSVQTKFADNIAFPVPFAFADSERVPNLLGRLGVFDQLQVDFDATLTQTEIRPPWLSPSARRVWEFLLETEEHVLSRFPDIELSDFAKKAIRSFIRRGEQIIASAYAMVRQNRCYGGPALIRAMFEISLQFEYLMQEPELRGEQYCEFSHITRHEKMQAIVENPAGYVSRRLSSSPKRAEGEKRNQAEYERVRPRFSRKDKQGRDRIWDNWYGKKLRNLAAQDLNRDGAYRFVYALTSAWAHGDPASTTATFSDPFCDAATVFQLVMGYYARMLLAVVEKGKTIVSNEQYEFLSGLAHESW